MWEHEKLAVYGEALGVAARLDIVARRIPAGRKDLRDQLRRASASIPLNIAEGANEFRPIEKSRFYRMARRSAGECASILDLVAAIYKRVEGGRQAKQDLNNVASSLTLLINAQGRRG